MFEPEVETFPWDQQLQQDAVAYKEQIRYLFAHSEFYKDKLGRAGITDPAQAEDLSNIHELPLTAKDELRQSTSNANAIGTHLANASDLCRIFSTSGTTGMPSYIPLTRSDLNNWVQTSARSYSAAGLHAGERLISTYNAGPFAAGAALDAFNLVGVCHIPVGTGNTERLMSAIQLLNPTTLACTPSYAFHLAEWAKERDINLHDTTIKRILVAGEPGGGEAAMRSSLESAWGAKVTEAMGIGDISISLWGECEHQQGMHFSGRGFVHFELIDPVSEQPVPIEDGAEGELVLTHLKHEAAPLLRFRTRDHVVVSTTPCACGRTAPRVRCIGRTDEMLVVRGVNVFPTAIREIVARFAPRVSGALLIEPTRQGFKQTPPLPIKVELADGMAQQDTLAVEIEKEIRAALIVTTSVELVPFGTLPRSSYKNKLVDFSQADI